MSAEAFPRATIGLHVTYRLEGPPQADAIVVDAILEEAEMRNNATSAPPLSIDIPNEQMTEAR